MANSASDRDGGHGSMRPFVLASFSESVYKRAFSILDDDKDGRISTLDIQRCLGWVGQDVDISYLRQLIINCSQDSYLRYDTFLRSVVWKEKDKKVNGWHKEFRKYEKDDGYGITAKSLKKMLSKLGEKRTTQQCVKMIRSFYPNNGDDVINFEEFKVLRFFSTFLERVEYNITKKTTDPSVSVELLRKSKL